MRHSKKILELVIPKKEGVHTNVTQVKNYIFGYVDATMGWEMEGIIDNQEDKMFVHLWVHDLAPMTFEMTNALEKVMGVELASLEHQ